MASNDRIYGVLGTLAVKPPCASVSTTNITLSGEQTVNSVALVAGHRCLVTGQTDQTTNGIYVVSTTAWTRAADFDGGRDVIYGTLVIVAKSGELSNFYECYSPNPIVIGTSNLLFRQVYARDVTYAITAAETAAGVTIVDDSIEPGNILRYGAVAGNGNVANAAVNTIALQAAINVTSYQNGTRIYVPGGHYIYNTVYGFYDATDNPNFSQSTLNKRHGKFLLVGDGKVGKSTLANLSTGSNNITLLEGSVLEAASGQRGLVIGGEAENHEDSPHPAREFRARDISFFANNTTYCVESTCPSFEFHNCSFFQKNTAGNGVYAYSSWFASFSKCDIFGPDTATSTGTGVVAGTTTSAGFMRITDTTLINNFRDSISWGGTEQWRHLIVIDSELIFGRYGMNISFAVELLIFQRNHIEAFDGYEDKVINATAKINQAIIRDNWLLVGTDTAGLSGPMFDFSSVGTVDIENNSVFRPYGNFCNITASDNVNCGYARNNKFIKDTSAAAGPLYMFTGILPELESNVWTGMGSGLDAGGVLNLYDTTTQEPALLTCAQTGTRVIPRLSAGDITIDTGLSTQYTVSSTTGQTVYDLTCTAAINCLLPNGATQLGGRLFVIKNNTASSHTITVRNSSGSAITNGDLPAGYTGLFVLDRPNDVYVVLMVAPNT